MQNVELSLRSPNSISTYNAVNLTACMDDQCICDRPLAMLRHLTRSTENASAPNISGFTKVNPF